MSEIQEQTPEDVGLVAIGRNEGERLRICLESVVHRVARAVYVDSGSTDGSVELAESLGVEVVQLDLSIPFTAARARNAGLSHIVKNYPEINYVQFVDGDCEVLEVWLQRARRALEEGSSLAAVCGRRRERHPFATIYNLLCDIEWDTPVGEASATGGDAMMRVEALAQVNAFDETLIAGEEPELCFRMRAAGWGIERMDVDMTLHDAAMTKLSQWWSRHKRAGHAYAEGAWLHGRSPERYNIRDVQRIAFWGIFLPLVTLLLAWPTRGIMLLLLFGYLVITYRAYQHTARRGYPFWPAFAYAISCTASKFPQAFGMLQFIRNRLLRRKSTLIEYK